MFSVPLVPLGYCSRSCIEFVEPEGVRQPVDRVELAGDEDSLEDLVIRKAGRAQSIDVLICHLVGMLRELQAEPQQRLVLLFDRQRLDVRRFGRLRRLLAASYEPQEKRVCLRSVGA